MQSLYSPCPIYALFTVHVQYVLEIYNCVLIKIICTKKSSKVLYYASLFRKLGGGDFRLIYRHYATLYFVFCVDSAESELGVLDLIQVTFFV